MADSKKVQIPYFESIRQDRTKAFKPKSWSKLFQQSSEQVYETDIQRMITVTDIQEQIRWRTKIKYKKTSYRRYG